MDTKVQRMADDFAARSGETLDQWVRVLEQGAALHGRARLTEVDLHLLGSLCPRSSAWLPMLELLARRPIRHPQDPGPLEGIRTFSRESSFSLEDWLQAIYAFLAYLNEQGQQAELDKLLGYLSCVEESALRLTTRPSLRGHLLDNLEIYGFEG